MTTIIRIKYLGKNYDYLLKVDSDYVHIMIIIIIESPLKNDGNSQSEAEMLVNINCPIRMILDYIRKIACLDNTCK